MGTRVAVGATDTRVGTAVPGVGDGAGVAVGTTDTGVGLGSAVGEDVVVGTLSGVARGSRVGVGLDVAEGVGAEVSVGVGVTVGSGPAHASPTIASSATNLRAIKCLTTNPPVA